MSTNIAFRPKKLFILTLVTWQHTSSCKYKYNSLTIHLKCTNEWEPALNKRNTWQQQNVCFQGHKKVLGFLLRRTEECWWLPSCSALGVVLRRLLCEHSSLIAYPAATVQTGDSQSNQTMPCLQTRGRGRKSIVTRGNIRNIFCSHTHRAVVAEWVHLIR